jgi:hypothetical protein
MELLDGDALYRSREEINPAAQKKNEDAVTVLSCDAHAAISVTTQLCITPFRVFVSGAQPTLRPGDELVRPEPARHCGRTDT